MARSIFITGTDTGVGKTYFTSGIVRALRASGVDAVGFKPIECGGRSDGQAILEASGGNHSLDEINPVWLEKPLAPLAAVDSPEDLPLQLIHEAHQKLINQHELVLVEGAGGWLVPVSGNQTMADLACELCREVIIVAGNRLGVVNHTLLTWHSVFDRMLDCRFVVLNHLPCSNLDPDDQSQDVNAETIRCCLPDTEVLELRNSRSFSHLIKQMQMSKNN